MFQSTNQIEHSPDLVRRHGLKEDFLNALLLLWSDCGLLSYQWDETAAQSLLVEPNVEQKTSASIVSTTCKPVQRIYSMELSTKLKGKSCNQI